ncbi:AbrB/MazE/SpoVT family DNA-binding domain-containing protein [Comamonas sp. MYb396]|uniref:AbrB/MazE/SpoVT family DNA-binding domain-containing protein n=1 Tax=Comamonas sp. MYb396 TaxID=2745302 RepID=UPI0030A9E0C5
MQLTIRAFGNSKGVVLPKTLLVQAGLDTAQVADVQVVDGSIVIKAQPAVRSGWAAAAAAVAQSQDDRLVMGEFGNSADADLVWDEDISNPQQANGLVEW